MLKHYLYYTISILMLLALSGCLRQEVEVTLNADGSGTYVIKRYLNDIESSMVGAEKFIEAPEGDAAGKKKKEGIHLKEISRRYSDNDISLEERYEIIEFAFENLAKALPELEDRVPLGPRYIIEGDEVVVFVAREKQQWDGHNRDKEEEYYYKLTINLPVKPTSADGEIEGKTVSWEFDTEGVETYCGSEIGARLLEARIPADSVALDLKPRLHVIYADDNAMSRMMEQERNRVSPYGSLKYKAKFDILQDERFARGKDKKNVDWDVNFEVKDFSAPLSYQNLRVKELVLAGEKIETELKTNVNGVISGKDSWDKLSPGFPLSLSFKVDDPWIERFDKLHAEVDLVRPTKLREYGLTFAKPEAPYPSLIDPDTLIKRIIVTELELGSNTSIWPNPSIKILTEVEPGAILNVYLDTSYGLRYRATKLNWRKRKLDDLDDEVGEYAKEVYGDGIALHEGTLEFKTIPSTPFKLVFECVEEKALIKTDLVMEDINVADLK